MKKKIKLHIHAQDEKALPLLHIKNREADKNKVMADAMMKGNKIEEEIQKLISFENKSE